MITEVEMFLPIVNNQATFIHQCQDITLSINNPNEIFIHEKECKPLTKFAVETLVSEDYSTNLNQINYKLIDNSLYQSNEFNNNEKVSNVYFTQNPVNQSTIIECNDSLLNKDEILQTIDTEPVVVSSVMLMDDKSMPMSSSSISPQIDIGTPLLDENTDLMEEISNNNNNGVGSGGSSNLPVDLQPIKLLMIESSRDYGGYYENRHHSHSYRNSYHQSKSSNNFDQYRSSTSKIPSYYIHHSQHNSRYDRKHQHQQLKENSHRHDEYNSRYRDSSSYRSRDRDDHTTGDNSSYSRHNHGDRSISNSSHRHQDRIYPTKIVIHQRHQILTIYNWIILLCILTFLS
ncbi:unnamed protein product [Heterobilharzia americana]|nr:unnamed protein product [Heterobilharzia americana]